MIPGLGGGVTVSPQSTTAVSVNPNASSGIGPVSLNLGSMGIGASRVPSWVWYAGAALVAFVIYKKFV